MNCLEFELVSRYWLATTSRSHSVKESEVRAVATRHLSNRLLDN